MDVVANEMRRFVGSTFRTRVRRRLQESGVTQLDLAEKTWLSEAAVCSYESETRNSEGVYREAIAEALGVSADYLREHDGYRESDREAIRSMLEERQ